MSELLNSTVEATAQSRPALSTIKVSGVRKVYRSWKGTSTVALDGIDGTVEQGRFVCVVGPSGCGKSTLLNLMAGFEAPTDGTIFVGEEEVKTPSSDRAVIFQDVRGALLPWLTAEANILLGLKLNGLVGAEAAGIAQEVLKTVGLTNAATKYPFELSGGMQQRVQIARALALDSSILLMDEPFGALDYFTRTALQKQLEQIFIKGDLSVVLITHDINEAVLLADEIWVMSPEGRLTEVLEISSPRPREMASKEAMEAVDYLRLQFEKQGDF